MRKLFGWTFALFAALLVCAPAGAETSAPPSPAGDDPAAWTDSAETPACSSAAPEAAPSAAKTLESALDGGQGARQAATCWVQNQTVYSCNCPNRRFRATVQEKVCCDNGWCSGWSTVSSSCTNYPC